MAKNIPKTVAIIYRASL